MQWQALARMENVTFSLAHCNSQDIQFSTLDYEAYKETEWPIHRGARKKLMETIAEEE